MFEDMPQTEVVEETYALPELIDLGPVPTITLGKYAEDSQDKGRYFE